MESLVCYKLDLGCVTTRSKGTIFPSTVAKVADRSTFITLFHTLHNPSIQKSGFLKEMRQGSGAWHGQKARVIASKTWVAYWVATSQTSFDFASIKSISKVLLGKELSVSQFFLEKLSPSEVARKTVPLKSTLRGAWARTVTAFEKTQIPKITYFYWALISIGR